MDAWNLLVLQAFCWLGGYGGVLVANSVVQGKLATQLVTMLVQFWQNHRDCLGDASKSSRPILFVLYSCGLLLISLYYCTILYYTALHLFSANRVALSRVKSTQSSQIKQTQQKRTNETIGSPIHPLAPFFLPPVYSTATTYFFSDGFCAFWCFWCWCCWCFERGW